MSISPFSRTVAETVAADATFTSLDKVIVAAGLTDTLKTIGPFTLFAPTDAAFARLPEGTLENWLKPENKAELVSVLQYHLVHGRVSTSEVGRMRDARTLQGEAAVIRMTDGRVTINDANVSLAELPSSNGVIYPIDKVIVPIRH